MKNYFTGDIKSLQSGDEINVNDKFILNDDNKIRTCLKLHRNYVVSSEIDFAEPINPGYLMYPKEKCLKVNLHLTY
jgi:hypothetical protein